MTFEDRMRLLAVGAILFGMFSGAMADADSLSAALTDGKVNADLRLRFETVDQEGFADDAEATTVRLRLGYETLAFHGFSAYVDFEGLRALGSEQYDSTANGKTQYPAVFDPEDEELNQLFLTYAAPRKTSIRLGRQRITLDDHRFIGNVGFRQLEQTFDALSVTGDPTERLGFFAAHLNNANRIFGEHHPVASRADTDLSARLGSVSFESGRGKLTAYAHFLEFEDSPAMSHRNLGLRFSGKHPVSDRLDLLYRGELTEQSDHADAPPTVDASYHLVELGLAHARVTGKLGYESLGGDGIYGFQTPLATLHTWNGWTDLFLTTPATGLEDRYVSLSGEVAGFELLGMYHDFSADTGGADYGTELGLRVGRKYGKLSWSFEYADYDSDFPAGGGTPPPFSLDTKKCWFTVQFKIG